MLIHENIPDWSDFEHDSNKDFNSDNSDDECLKKDNSYKNLSKLVKMNGNF